MLSFSKKRSFLLTNIFVLFAITLINFLILNDNFGNFVFLNQHITNKTVFDWINFYFGFSFIPCLLISFYSLIKDGDSYFYLYFIYMLSLDFLLGSFEYGGAISTMFYYRSGKYITLIISLVLNLIGWCIFLVLILEFTKKQILNKKRNLRNVNAFINEEDVIHLPNKSLLSIGKKEEIYIDLDEQKKLLEKTLLEFGVEAKVVNVFVGPVVTLYSIELAPGIKSVRVINLVEDIARFMEAFSVRISAIPGQNLLGVEVSNKKRQMVYFKEGLLSEKYTDFEGNLPLYLGCNIYGKHEVFDLSEMPHLLVAGTTGSGKSVGIHTMLLSLLFQKSFNELKLILIDPKKLELTPYEDIPHLLLPVVTEAKEAIRAVKWAVKEMESRYQAMAQIGVRNITSYNQKILELKDGESASSEKFPYIVIVIDEMADLMMLAGKELELCVQRLAQMGRAAGVHMIIATQRPSVDVITGTIKANFPTRISFRLSTKIDSRTILGDMSGAEQLLGAGDMLYLGNAGKVIRIHGSYVSEEDVLLVVDFLKNQSTPKYIDITFGDIDEDTLGSTSNEKIEDDPLYDEAVSIIRREKKVSTSFLQRCFPIGYNRAAKLIERMEKEGIISKGDRFGRNREIL